MDRLFTVPNLITLIRLCCLPWFVWLVFGQGRYYEAAWLLAVLGATDWIDGWIARHFDQVSTIGKVFDPTVDRLFLAVSGISLMVVGAMPLWFGLVVLAREVLVGVAGIVLAFMGAPRIDVKFIGKAGAWFLMFSLPLFLASHSTVSWHETARLLAWIFGIPGLVFSWYSVVGYLDVVRKKH